MAAHYMWQSLRTLSRFFQRYYLNHGYSHSQSFSRFLLAAHAAKQTFRVPSNIEPQHHARVVFLVGLNRKKPSTKREKQLT
jgi:hypothetical protein